MDYTERSTELALARRYADAWVVPHCRLSAKVRSGRGWAYDSSRCYETVSYLGILSWDPNRDPNGIQIEIRLGS